MTWEGVKNLHRHLPFTEVEENLVEENFHFTHKSLLNPKFKVKSGLKRTIYSSSIIVYAKQKLKILLPIHKYLVICFCLKVLRGQCEARHSSPHWKNIEKKSVLTQSFPPSIPTKIFSSLFEC